MSFRFRDYPLGHRSVPDDPSISTYGQDGGYCECGEHVDSGRCACDPCEIGTCDHFTHCDGCSRGMAAYSETGFCFVCEAEFAAAHQLTFPGNGRLSGGVDAASEYPSLDARLQTCSATETRDPVLAEKSNGDFGDSRSSDRPAQTLAEQSQKECIGVLGFIEQFNRRYRHEE